MLDDDSYYFEISGIPDYDVDDDDDSLSDIDLKKPTKVQFSIAPIRVCHVIRDVIKIQN